MNVNTSPIAASDASSTTPPRVSVNISIYNCEPYLRKTLDSLVAQTFTDWECIIVDDASTDASAVIAQEYADRDPRIILHRLDAATKDPYPACRNKAVELSRGKWIAPLDGDDWWEPTKLQKQVALMESDPRIVISSVNAWIWRDGKVEGSFAASRREDVARILPLRNMLIHPGVMIDREAMCALGIYDTKMQAAQDWDLWLKVLWKHGPEAFAFLPEAMYYRMHDRNVTRNVAKSMRFEWIVTRRTLAHYGWGFKNPIKTWRLLSERFNEDAPRLHQSNRHAQALLRTCLLVMLQPLSSWRWRALKNSLRQCFQAKPSQAPAAS